MKKILSFVAEGGDWLKKGVFVGLAGAAGLGVLGLIAWGLSKAGVVLPFIG